MFFIFAAEQTSDDEDDPGLDGPDMEENLLSPASLIQLEDSVGPGNNTSYSKHNPRRIRFFIDTLLSIQP